MKSWRMVLTLWLEWMSIFQKKQDDQAKEIKPIINKLSNSKRQAAAVYSLLFISMTLYELYLLNRLGFFQVLLEYFLNTPIGCLIGRLISFLIFHY